MPPSVGMLISMDKDKIASTYALTGKVNASK